MPVISGGCLCGVVRYEVKSDPVMVRNCHCDDCRRATGGAFATIVFVRAEDLVVLKGETKQFDFVADSGNPRAQEFCANCGTLALDEPTVGIDIEGQARFSELLDTIHQELNLTIVIVSHDVRAIAAGCDRVACLARTLHFHDAPQGLTPQVLAEVFQHDVAGAFGDVHVEAHRAEECPGGHAHTHTSGSETS